MTTGRELIYKDNARAAVLKENPSVVHCIDDVKAVEATPVVHGYWIENYEFFDGKISPVQIGWKCSVCNEQEMCKKRYCPNCGAIMDGGNNNGV